MANTSTVGIPFNCKNWLALAATVYGNVSADEALSYCGLKTRRDQTAWREKHKHEVRKMYGEGMTLSKIADILCTSRHNVKKCWLMRINLALSDTITTWALTRNKRL